MKPKKSFHVALVGNPNVGKSTIFNALTGLHQHTGNWPGKTVCSAFGQIHFTNFSCQLIDLPGTYSLSARSAEEEVSRDYICRDKPDCIIVVCDSTCLERNLYLVLQILEITPHVIVCVNLLDEAKKKQIHIQLKKLSNKLHCPVIGTCARDKKSISNLLKTIEAVLSKQTTSLARETTHCPPIELDSDKEKERIKKRVQTAETICKSCVSYKKENYRQRDQKIDQFLTGRFFAFPVMLLFLLFIFWLTITGANYPSSFLFTIFSLLENKISNYLITINAPTFINTFFIQGMFRVLSWVVSVMLPPMAIFFPLFTLLEDIGYLPRIAFNLDCPFQKCHACGKQALSLCMGFGCNAAGVMGCRIISSKRERLIAILTNSFIPCNGRFPTLITICFLFFITGPNDIFNKFLCAVFLVIMILFSIGMTFFTSFLLSKTLLKGVPSSFILELPPYRKPQIGKILVRSIFDRTLFVLGRAVIIAAPAGLLLSFFANIPYGNTNLLNLFSTFLNPIGKFLGLDGAILTAFILALPANEIILPIIIMIYMSKGSITEYESMSHLKLILIDNGWTPVTAICTILFLLFHWPCSTTLLTIKKETGSIPLTLLAALLPTITGIILCFFVSTIAKIFGY